MKSHRYGSLIKICSPLIVVKAVQLNSIYTASCSLTPEQATLAEKTRLLPFNRKKP